MRLRGQFLKIYLHTWFISDELRGLNLWSLKDGGLVFQVQIKAPLLIRIRLKIVYSDASDMNLMTSTLSEANYFNTTTMCYIEFSGSVPFDSFHVMVGLVYENEEGLLFNDGIIYTSKQVKLGQ